MRSADANLCESKSDISFLDSLPWSDPRDRAEPALFEIAAADCGTYCYVCKNACIYEWNHSGSHRCVNGHSW